MSGRGLMLPAALAGVLSLAWGSWLAGRPQAPGASRGPALQPSTPVPPPALPAEFTAGPETGVVRFVDAAGQPLAGAMLWDQPAGARCIDPAAGTLLGKGDEAGRLQSALPSPGPGRELVAQAPRGRAATLPAALLPGLGGVTVRFAPAHELTVRCVTRAGEPVAGVLIVLGRTLDADAAQRAVPDAPGGGDPCTALHAARSDETGRASVRGLGAQRYAFDADHPDHVLLSGEATVDVPHAGMDLVFAPLLGCVLVPPPGSTVRAGGLHLETGMPRLTPGALHRLRRARDRLQQAHAGAFVQLLPWPAGARRQKARAKVLLDDAWVLTEVDLVPLPQLSPAPLSRPSGAVDRCGELVLTFPDGPPAHDCGLSVRNEEDGIVCHVPLGDLHAPLRLPPGTYELDSRAGAVRKHLLPAPFVVHAGQRVEYAFAMGSAQAVLVAVRGPGGAVPERAAIHVRRAGELLDLAIANAGSCQLLLPRGELELHVHAHGYAPTARTLRLPDPALPTTIAIDLDHAR